MIALYVHERLDANGLDEMYMKTTDYFIPVHSIATALDLNEQRMLPFLHAVSGCDTNGFFYGKGKTKFLKISIENNLAPQIADLCKSMECDVLPDELVDQSIRTSTTLLKAVYIDSSAASVHDIMCHLYARKSDIKRLPPTDDSYRQHILRAIYQTCIWVKSCQSLPQLSNVFTFGWQSLSDCVKPLLMTIHAIPSSIHVGASVVLQLVRKVV